MTYRDDRDADQARIAALETELRTARERIDELEGNRALVLVRNDALAVATTRGAKIFGGPRSLKLFRKFDKPLGREHFESLVVCCRDRAGAMGRSELLSTSMMWTREAGDRGVRPNQTVTVVVRDGATTLQVTDQLGALAGAIYGGVGGGVGGGGLAVPIVLSAAAPMLAPVILGAWFAGAFGLTRALYKRAVRRRATQLQALFDALVDEIERTLA
ncbi:MAG TPA: hypothetical protein VGG28_24750 [Kofleriaceae bacterium]|jgi:hypothetical protein